MGLERQVIAACGSAVCGDDLAMEVPVRGPAAAPVEASVVATSNRKRRAPSCPPGRPPESGSAALVRHAAAGFLMGLVGFAALLALPLQAQAQTTVWSATLTPRTTFSGTPVSLGCDNTSTGNRRCSNSNTLSDDFTDDSKTYAVTKFFTRNGVLTFRLDTGATAATQGLTLVIDGEEFVLKEADQINGAKTQWKWNSTTLGWTAGTDVAVSLVVTDAPATGQPTISGGGQVGKTLTAATDDIEDLDGLPTTPTFTYQWVRVDGSTDTDIPGAASETYTLTASDPGKQIKVKVSFTDSRGHAEGPLTSGAYPRNGTVTVVVLPGPCPAVNDWCATMTVADDGTGFGYEFDKSGSLDDNMIEYGGKEIEVFKVYVVNQPTRERFFFESFPRVPLGTVITVGDLTLTTDTDSNDGITADKWDYLPGELPPDLLWSDGQEVRVSLVLGSFPAEGTVTISGTAQVGQTLTADPSGITDTDGLTTATFTYQWLRVDADGVSNETNIGANAATYTPVAADVGKQIKVQVSFTDDRGHVETVTSDADPSSGTIMLPAGVTVSKSALTVTEEDATGDTYTVVLNSQPTASVTVTVGGYTGSDVTPNPASLAWAPSVWNIPLTVTVTAEGDTNTVDETVSLTHSATSTDTDYSGITIASVTVTVDDNDNTPPEGTPTISGTAQVGQTLTADPSGITDTDGLTTATYTYQWLRVDADGVSNETNIGANAATYTPVAADVGKQIKVQVSFTDDRGHVETVTSDATVAVTGNDTGPALSIADASAAETAGHLLFDVTLSRSLRNTVKVDFETISGGTATEGVDYYARRTYTHVILAGDKTAQMGFALIEDAVAAAGETVKVKLSNARVVDAYGDKIKDLDITTDEATGTITAPATTTTNVAGLTIGIRDATGDEDDGWLDFRVRLSRKYTDLVCYDFETISGGSATEGTDYLKIPKATYWMQKGKRVDKPFVRIIDDAVNDNGETVKVKISNAHLCGDASRTVSITRAEATGTITNSDPIPQAWLARFGRTVAEHVLDGVQARLSAPRNPGIQANVAGLWNLGTTADTTADTPADTALAAPGEAPQDGLRAHSDWIEGGLAGTDPGTSAALNLTARDLITGSAFAATGETAGGGFAAVWGRGAYSSFSGQDSDVTLDGEVTTAMLGADYAAGRWIAGVSLSVSEGEGTYGLDGKEGELDSSLTGFYPYVGYDISERLSAWGVAGYGEGNIKLTQPDTTETIRTGIDLAMVAVGARGDLMPRTEAAGFDLALTSDALMVRTTSAAAAGLVATDADVSRLRLGLDGSWLVALDSGASLTPSISIGMRHDGGDAETGFGVDLGGGLAYADEQSGLGLELNARALLAHEDENFREWGVSGALIFDPDPSSDRGLSLSVGPSWGASSTGGAEALLGPETMSGLALDNATPPGGRLDAEAAWGFPALAGRYTGTPYLGLGLRQGGRDLTLGWRLGAVRREGLELALGLEGRRLESNGRSPEHGAMVRLILRW